jgi:hypothetical protein
MAFVSECLRGHAIAASVACLTAVLLAPSLGNASETAFASPPDAAEALAASVRSGNMTDMVAVLGKEAKAIVSSGDDVADAAARKRFVDAYDAKHEIRQADNGASVLYIGEEDFPFPLPLVQDAGKWRFDTAAGIEEILDRRIGANELAAVKVLQSYVDAQREYAETDRDGKGPQYAQRILSREGKQDGLYWPTAEGVAESPFGPLIAQARGEGYRKKSDKPEPYHGYLFRILTSQGKDASGGERNYMAGGRMIGGFGLIATPAEFGNSGVMTFMVDQDGTVFEKDLGADTAGDAQRIRSFNPDASWKRVEDQ